MLRYEVTLEVEPGVAAALETWKRNHFARRFPSGVSVSRETWEELDTWE